MPLARFQLRNEFGLGKPELYSEASREDPKAVLDGIAVAGLVGILRQLGDLAEFAAEVFHGLQEQVTITASRSHNMMVRVQHIEAALPSLEKRVLAQTSHLPFAYTAGSDWHVRIRNEQHQFIDNDLPRFIMDSYEECRDPPRLHLLDKFDTDGPGSCLRRYSDPTFFRRVSMKFDEPNTVNMRRDKKGHKVKKKRSFPKNGEYSRGTSISKSSGRMKFSSSAYNGQTSPSISVDDVRFKSGMRDSINSLGSRSESGYIECTFDQNENEPLEELGSYRSSSSMMIQHDDSIDSVSQDEKIWTVEDNSAEPTSQTSQGRVASNASSVTWDEKTEILEPTDQKRDTEEPIAMISSTYSDVDEQEEIVNIPTVDEFNGECKEDIRSKSILLVNSVDDEIEREADNCVVDGIPKPILHENQVDDIDSEPDCYVDALNTIESESETDHDYQMKREMEQHMAEVEYTETSASVQEPMSQSPVHHISGMESNGDSDSTSNKEMPSELLELALPESSAETQIPEAAGEVASSDCLPSISMLESSDLHVGSDSKRECDEFAQPSSGSIPTTNVIPSYFPEHHESPVKLAAANFWTNGGLLGLQPSKPADFAPSNNADTRKRDKDITAHPTDHNSVTTDGRDKTGILGENCDNQGKETRSNHPTSFLINKDNKSTKKTALVSSLADLYARYDKSCDSDPNNKGASISGNGSSSITVAPGSAMPVAPTAKVTPVEIRKESDENLSGVFGLRQRLFVNSFRKKIPFVYDEKSEQASSTKARVMEQFEVGSPVNSLPPSPPLEHMKLSFHPVNDFETSKLGLKFTFDKNGQESIRDSFASFQLVPETSVGLHGLGSDSDDDTFYRSSPCTSDGCLSRDSDSNSEQWESGGTAKVGVQDQCDVNIVAEGQRSRALNLLSFDSFESLPKLENDMDSCQPPPAEWRASKPQKDMEKEEEQVPGVPNHYPEPEHLLSSSVQELPQQQVVHSMQLKIAQEIILVTADRMSSLQDYQQKHATKEAYQSGNYGKVMDDEKEDFLQQIRTKSFNLRRTFPAKDASGAASVATTPTPNANVKVSAILEKANAIRQAVGSDDGEDDSWSDT